MPAQRLAGLNTRVTDSDRGIGQAMAPALGQESANVSGHYHHANDGALEMAEAVLNQGVQAMTMQADLSRGRDLMSFVEPSVEQ
jgi:glucose 1-dehydrogenase